MRESPPQLSPPTFLGNFEDLKSTLSVRFFAAFRYYASPMEEVGRYGHSACNYKRFAVGVSLPRPPFNWSHTSAASRANMASTLALCLSARAAYSEHWRWKQYK